MENIMGTTMPISVEEFISMKTEIIRYEFVRNAVKCHVPVEYIDQMMRGEKTDVAPASETISLRTVAMPNIITEALYSQKEVELEQPEKSIQFSNIVDYPVPVEVEKPKEEPKKKKKLDTGKIKALHNAGWSNIAIAEEMGCSEWSVWNHLNETKENG